MRYSKEIYTNQITLNKFTLIYNIDLCFYINLCYKHTMDTAKNVGNNIKQARKAMGYTQSQVADILHMTQQQYSRFENGVFQLNYEQILAICDILDITPNDIFSID